MKRLLLSLLAVFGLFLTGSAQTTRYQALLNAKHLTLVTQKGNTYYYIISSESSPMMRLGGQTVVVQRDTFSVSDISQMRLRTIPRFLLNEDSTRFGKDYAIDHGLLALRRSLAAGQWNSIVLPVALTGQQVRDAFGQDAQVAQVRGFRQGDNATVEYETVDLDTKDVALLANFHYIIRPSREPDLPEGKTGAVFGSDRPKGPLYLIPDASMDTKQTPAIKSYHSDGKATSIMLRGSYTVRDGSTTLNKKLPPGAYVFNEQGRIEQHTDSVELKAFSSWITDMSDVPAKLCFYIDGISEDLSLIGSLMADGKKDHRAVYDLQGRRLDGSATRKGIYIINGKKVFVK